MNSKAKGVSQPGQRHMADNLTDQLNSIMVQMGRMMAAQKSNPDRADLIAMNSRKKMEEATDSFHQTLDEMEIELTRAKAVLLRDLETLREKNQAPQQPAAPMQAQPPAPMAIDLGDLKPTGPAVPVAPMMATGGSPFIASHGIPKADGKPVAPFPDMGGPIGAPKPAVPAAFARAKPPIDQKRPPPPKQPTPTQTPKPAPKSNPPSGRLANKPNPLANAQKQAPKAPASAPPSGSAAAPAAPAPVAAPAPMTVAPPAPVAPVAAPQALPPATAPAPAAPQNSFTNATFTVDSSNNDTLMQSGNGSIDLDAMLDMDSFGAGGPSDPANMDLSTDQDNDTAMGDLDHFFDDMGGGTTSNFDDANFGNMDTYMEIDGLGSLQDFE